MKVYFLNQYYNPELVTTGAVFSTRDKAEVILRQMIASLISSGMSKAMAEDALEVYETEVDELVGMEVESATSGLLAEKVDDHEIN